MTGTERIHACYLHACLRYLMHDYMSNESLRERFGISRSKSYNISKLIAAAKKKGLIAPAEAEQSNKYAEYYTPHAVAKIMAACLVTDERHNVSCYAPSGGSGTLLMNLAHRIGEEKCSLYSQDISQKSSGLLRLNLILNNLVHFIQHIIHTLSKTGKPAIVVPTGFITAQSGIDKKIRQHLVQNKMLAGVVSMTSNIFATTGTNVSILFLDATNKEGVVLIDASKLGKKVKDGKNQKTLLSTEEEDRNTALLRHRAEQATLGNPRPDRSRSDLGPSRC